MTQGFCEERVLADPQLRANGIGSGLIQRFSAGRPVVTARKPLSVRVRLAKAGRVSVTVLRGRRVVRRVAATRARRSHRLLIRAHGLPAGVLRVQVSGRAGRERDVARLSVARR